MVVHSALTCPRAYIVDFFCINFLYFVAILHTMAHTKTSGRRTKKVWTKKTGFCSHLTDSAPLRCRRSSSRDDVSQKLDALAKAVTDLSKRVEAMEEHQKEGGASPLNSPSTSRPRRRVKHQETPDKTPEMAEEVHRRVAKRLRELPAYYEATSEEEYTSDDEEQ